MTTTTRISPNKNGRNGTVPDLIVLHDQEGDSTADQLGQYLLQPKVQASYHKIVDRDGNVCIGCPDELSAWAAGPIANTAGLHICLTGYASWTREQWLARPAQLEAVAQEVAAWVRKYPHIPVQLVSAAALASPAGGSGICGHDTTAEAWRETNHSDPGKGCPRDVIIDRVRAILGGTGTTPTTPEDDDVSAWDADIDNKRGTLVKARDLIGWIDRGVVLLLDTFKPGEVSKTRVDFGLLARRIPGYRVPEKLAEFDVRDAIFNADGRAFEARELVVYLTDEVGKLRADVAALTAAVKAKP